MKTDVLIIGGGPAGAASAMFLIEQGIKPVILEAHEFPRYHIGESMTGAAGQVVRELGLEAEMFRAGHPVKHGITFYGPNGTSSWFVPVAARDQQGQLCAQTAWQVRRSSFDKMLLDAAVARGATLLRGKALTPIVQDGVVRGAQVRMQDGGVQSIHSEMLLDCSGQGTWLANQGGVTGPKYLGAYDKQIAIFSQVSGAICDQGSTPDMQKGNTLLFYRSKYHWAWFIPLDDETVSVGVVLPAAYFRSKGESKRDFLLRELHELNPELKRRLPEIKLVEDVHAIPNYSHQVKNFGGKGFLCVGDAHRFIDPIFSFGMAGALREAQFAAPAVAAYLGGAGRDLANPFARHQLFCEKGIDIMEDVIDTFWEYPVAFGFCVQDRYPDLMVDMFAGRVYEHEGQPSAVLHAFRDLLRRREERERAYLEPNMDSYSIPIGSRYHPERAAIWEADASTGLTEAWMRMNVAEAPAMA
ncbi:MAG: FAD-dependent monooxygenase [Rhodocyclaceae bacterium]|nr:FAD-dependent monooxygenase [Rhodocyclaceae bacterium]